MKWMRLKIYLLPLIMQEVDSVTEIFINLINEIRVNNDPECNTLFLELRAEITKRIEELEQFFEENIRDTRVSYIEKARIKLKKLLMYDPDVLNKMQSSNYDDNQENEEISKKEVNVLYFNKKKETLTLATEQSVLPNQNNKTNPKNSGKIVSYSKILTKTISNNTNFTQKSDSKNFQKAGTINKETLSKQTLNNNESNKTTIKEPNKNGIVQSKTISNSDRKQNENLRSKLSSDSGGIKHKLSSISPRKINDFGKNINQDDNQTNDLITAFIADNSFNMYIFNYFSLKDQTDWKEICFKLRLTDNEYKLFIREKANRVTLK